MMSKDDGIKPLLAKTADGLPLSSKEAEIAFELIMTGNATPAQIGAFLMALRVRGETIDEIFAAAKVMRLKATKISAPNASIDIVGTGGDGFGTLNISTGAALVVAACGVPVAKHGNRALSSRSGAADVLTALGVNIECEMSLIEESINHAGFGFMMAPRHHSATRHVAGPRVELATRTIFNVLGPLSNPAGVKRLLVGVFSEKWVEPLAHVLGKLGAEKAWVVHGSDGLDEMTLSGPTYVAEYENGSVNTFECSPADAGLIEAPIKSIQGGDAAYNADALTALLNGEHSPYRDIVCYTSAGALVVAGVANQLGEGVEIAQRAIDEGQAKRTLQLLIEITNKRSNTEI
ncbi:MAG: anthranilate phosphoribosyltransferase [Pseudomonadota bacterium]|nr:anthranilate phosphoribosyltransferase [Pseudomonadota bacterium]